MCSFFAIFASLFAISSHSETGGACLSNKWAFLCSIFCSIVVTCSSAFGAYLSVEFALRASDSPIKGEHEAVINKLKIDVLHNEIAILQSCLYLESALQDRFE